MKSKGHLCENMYIWICLFIYLEIYVYVETYIFKASSIPIFEHIFLGNKGL
jgi:hypothetical protein